MRSGISCFNGPLFRKNAARFWPVWVSYTVLWVFLLPLPFLTLPGRYSDPAILAEELADQAEYVIRLLRDGVGISAVFGVAAAMAVFSYLFFHRSAYMMHSLPMDRNTLFCTNYLSGLSFLLLPHGAVFLLTAAVETMYGCLRMEHLLTWLVVQSGTALFFYSFAVFCAMFTGNILALPAFYGILSFLVYAADSLASAVLSMLLYGYMGGSSAGTQTIVQWLTPVVMLTDACDVAMVRVGDGWTRGSEIQDPAAVAIYAVAALVLTGAALMVYHRRHVESAGDVVAIPIVRPLFRYGVALCAGLAFGVWTAAILSVENELALLIFIVLWAVTGYFVAEMLLQKSFRVWKKWKGAVVLAAVLCLLCTSLAMDWYGYETRIPNAGEVEAVRIRSMNLGAPYDSARAGDQKVTDPRHIQMLLDLHQAVIDQRPAGGPDAWEAWDDHFYFTVEYQLEGGKTMLRRYPSIPVYMDDVQTPGTVSYAATALLGDREFVRRMYDFDRFEGYTITQAYVDNFWTERGGYYEERMVDTGSAGLQRLWQAVQADFEAGCIGVRYLFDSSAERRNNTYVADLRFRWEDWTDSKTEQGYVVREYGDYATVYSSAPVYELTITLTPQAERTLAVLEELGVLRREELYTHEQQRIIEQEW